MTLSILIPVFIMFCLILSDVIIWLFFSLPFLVTDIVLYISSTITGFRENAILEIICSIQWLIITLGGIAAAISLIKNWIVGFMLGIMLGIVVWFFQIFTLLGHPAMSLHYPILTYGIIEFTIIFPFFAFYMLFLTKKTE